MHRCFFFRYITNGTNCTSSALRLLIPEWKPVSNSGNVTKLALPVVFSWFNIDGFDVDISTFFSMWIPEAWDDEWPDLNRDSSTW